MTRTAADHLVPDIRLRRDIRLRQLVAPMVPVGRLRPRHRRCAARDMLSALNPIDPLRGRSSRSYSHTQIRNTRSRSGPASTTKTVYAALLTPRLHFLSRHSCRKLVGAAERPVSENEQAHVCRAPGRIRLLPLCSMCDDSLQLSPTRPLPLQLAHLLGMLAHVANLYPPRAQSFFSGNTQTLCSHNPTNLSFKGPQPL